MTVQVFSISHNQDIAGISTRPPY